MNTQTLTPSEVNTINLSLSNTYYQFSEVSDSGEYTQLLETIQQLYTKLSGGETL